MPVEEHSPRPEVPVVQPEPILTVEPGPEPESEPRPIALLAAAPTASELTIRPDFLARLR